MNTIEIRIVDYNDADARELTDELQAEYRRRYGGNGDAGPISAGEFASGRGRFFVVYLDQVPIAMAGWRSGGPRAGDAEIKRMYVRPGFTRQGIARLLLTELEQTAKSAGIERLVLETGPKQTEAVALYSSAGYQPIEAFGYYCGQGSYHFGKSL